MSLSDYKQVIEIRNFLLPFVQEECMGRNCQHCRIATVCEKAIDLFQEANRIIKEEAKQK